MGTVARGISQRHHAAERYAQHDRVFDAEDVAEGAHVVAPLREIPAFARAVLAPAVAAMVEIVDLGGIGQGGVGGLIGRMVEAGTAMEEEQGRLLPHHGTIRGKLGALDVEE
jgi:hypothetical protein